MKIERKFIDCSENLAERIIKQSYNIKQKHSWSEMIRNLFADLSMPKPAYIMPAMFLFGLMISFSLGFYTSTETTADFIDGMYLSL